MSKRQARRMVIGDSCIANRELATQRPIEDDDDEYEDDNTANSKPRTVN